MVVQILTVADDSTLRERERNGLCQRPVKNLYKPITTRITETSEPRPATSLLRKAVMHEDDKNMFAATQAKGKTETSRVFFSFFLWISSLNNELPGHSLFNRSKTVSAYGSILPNF